jgi:hypothetical protein
MASLYLTLDLKKKTLEEMDNQLDFSFNEWEYIPPAKGSLYGTFELDELTINRELISTVVYDKEEEVLSFEADYDGEGYFDDIEITSNTEYNEKYLIKELDLKLDSYVNKNPLTGGEGRVKGEIKVYFDYDNEEFVIELNKLVLEED